MAIRSCLVTAVVAALASPVSATWHHGGPASPPVSDELLAARQKYALTFEDSQLKGFPMLRNMPPPEDITSNPYFLQYLMQKRDNPFRPLPPLPDFIIAVLTNASESPAQKALLGQVIYSIFDSFTTYRPEAGGRPNQTGGYDDMFAVGYETLPVAVGEVFSDEAFSRDRLSGPLPFALRKATWRLLAQMRLLASARSELIAKAVFALLCGRLYAVDHSAAEEKTAEGRYLARPVALFMIPADAAQNKREGLQVLCVQVRKGEPSSIAAPSDNKWAWTYAKVFFNHVESNLQESVHHLGETHLLVQSIGLSVKRSLPLDHPLHVLVDNHLHGTLTINWMANQTLLQPDGPVDTVLSTERVAFCEAAVQGVAAIAKADFTFPALMRARGLDEAAFPTKYYPYREFAGKLWNAIERFVGEYVAAYYPSDRAVNADGSLSHLRSELEQNGVAWVKSAWKRGRGSVKFLSKLLSAFVFTASVQHAAVGAPQLSHLSVINVFPLGWYSDPPADIADIDTEEELLAAFPELPTAYHQRDVLAGAAFAYRTFAVFDPSTYPEGAVRSAAEEFQRDLRQAEADMAARNEHWLSLWAHQTNVPQSQHANWQYKALYPSSVSMSVNV